MATDTRILMGEVLEFPDKKERNVENLLVFFLKALLEEQKLMDPPAKMREDQ